MKLRLRSTWWRRVLRFAARRALQLAENNDDPRSQVNGECWLLRALLEQHRRRGQSRPFVVIDAGANRGDYTALVLAEAARVGVAVRVHAFEPSSSLADLLRRRFADHAEVSIVNAGVGAAAGSAFLFGSEGSSQASLINRAAGPANCGTTVTVVRLESYLSSLEAPEVDLLKLDVEGFELPALQGAGEYLAPDIVKVVQFEYGGTTLDAGTTLRALAELVTQRGYLFGKLFPRAIEVRHYQPWMEHYAYANYVAVAPGASQCTPAAK